MLPPLNVSRVLILAFRNWFECVKRHDVGLQRLILMDLRVVFPVCLHWQILAILAINKCRLIKILLINGFVRYVS